MNGRIKVKKLISMMLGCIIMICLVPALVFAADGDEALATNAEYIVEVTNSAGEKIGYNSLQEAFYSVNTGDTVKLLKDVTLTEQVNIKRALNGLTFDGDRHKVTLQTTTDPSQSGGSGFYFGNPNESLWCTGIKIKNLTIDGKARFAIFLSGGTVSEFTNLNISGEFLYAVNLYGTHGGTFTDCNISNTLNLGDNNESGAAIWSNVAAANPVNLVRSNLGIIGINKYTTANTLAPKIFVDENSTVEVRSWDDGSVSRNPRLCVSPESKGEYVVKTKNAVTHEWVENVAMIGTSHYSSIGQAILAATNDQEITLFADVKEDVTIPTDKVITLNLAGKTLTNANGHTIYNNGTLTIEDTVGGGVVDNTTHSKAALYNVYGGEAILNGGKFTRSKESMENASNRYYVIDNRGNLTINSATVTKETAQINSSSLINNQSAGDNDEFVAELTINEGAKIESAFIAIKNGSVSIMTITGGEIKSTEKAILNYGEATIKNGTVYGLVESCDHYGVQGGEDPYYGDITIMGGTFYGDIVSSALYNGKDAVIKIEGGEFLGSIQKEKYINGVRYKQYNDFADAKIIISGGTFNEAIPIEFCAAGYVSTTNNSGKHTSKRYLESAKVRLGSDISMKIKPSEEYKDGDKLVVTMNDKSAEIGSLSDGYFIFNGITPQCMGDNIHMEVVRDDTVVVKYDYSVKIYLETIKNGEYSEEAKVFAKDMLVYGAAAQGYKNYKTDSLVTTEAVRETTLPTGGSELNNSEDAPKFTSASLWFDNVNKLRIYFTAEDGVNVTATVNGSNTVVTKCGNESYMIETDGIFASAFGTQYEFKLLVDGVQKSTLKYSVYDYIAEAKSLSDEKWQTLVKALYAYGESAKAYADSCQQGN